MKDHPLRSRLLGELHARPFTPLQAPLTLVHLAMVHDGDADRDQERVRLADLCRQHGAGLPDGAGNHVLVRLGEVSLKWEQHAEFTTWTFWRPRGGGEPFTAGPGEALGGGLPGDLPGQRLVGVHVEVLGPGDERLDDARLARVLDPSTLCGSSIGDGAAQVWTDYRDRDDGYLRVLAHDHAGDPRQLGRRLQRLLEMETYRSMALLALPVAQAAAPQLARAEARMREVTRQLEILADLDAEKALLAELMKLAAELEERVASTAYRFSAGRAYFDIVRARLASLPESPLAELPMLSGFIARRMSPAMSTCESIRQRQDALAARITRAANLLRTRVDLALEAQNRDLLASMERRARLQLRLQQTVEGLSVAAITYYVVGLVGYLAKAAGATGAPVDPDLATGAAVPVVALLIWSGLRRFRRRIEHEEEPGGRAG